MKGKTIKLLFGMVLLSMALVFNGCGSEKEEIVEPVESTQEPVEESEEEEEEKEEEDQKAADEAEAALDEEDVDEDLSALASIKFDTMEEFAATEEIQSQVEAYQEELQDSGMEVAIYGEDNKLVYSFKFLSIESSPELNEALASALDEAGSEFESIASIIKLAVNVDDPVVVVQYLDCNDEVMASQEFSGSAE